MVGDDGPAFPPVNNNLGPNETEKKVEQNQPFLSEGVSPESRVKLAACWLSQNRKVINGPAIPFIRHRFNLTILEAIDAAKAAHALQYQRAGE
jgi:hypothetical protein